MKISCQKEEGENSGNCPFEDNHLCPLTTRVHYLFYIAGSLQDHLLYAYCLYLLQKLLPNAVIEKIYIILLMRKKIENEK